MNNALPSWRTLHAVLAVGVGALALLFMILAAIGVAGHFTARADALQNAKSATAEFALRLDEFRNRTRASLQLIGATPEDLEVISNAPAAKELVETACADIAATLNGGCAIVETPLTPSLSLHQARLTGTGTLDAFVAALKEHVRSPAHVASVTIKQGPSPGVVKLSAVIEVAGQGSAGEAL